VTAALDVRVADLDNLLLADPDDLPGGAITARMARRS
jgi:hypothetical protein